MKPRVEVIEDYLPLALVGGGLLLQGAIAAAGALNLAHRNRDILHADGTIHFPGDLEDEFLEIV